MKIPYRVCIYDRVAFGIKELKHGKFEELLLLRSVVMECRCSVHNRFFDAFVGCHRAARLGIDSLLDCESWYNQFDLIALTARFSFFAENTKMVLLPPWGLRKERVRSAPRFPNAVGLPRAGAALWSFGHCGQQLHDR
jgi:hypothetical protein